MLDLSRYFPGAYCSLVLSDLGVEVVKVEEPGVGDPIRRIHPLKGNESTQHLLLNRNKKSITLDLKSSEGKDIFYELARDSDIILENFKPGVTDALGIGYNDIKVINPGLIYCSISGFGQDGPYHNLPGHDINFIGYSGMLGIAGQKRLPPTIPVVPIADLSGAMFAVISILSSCISRKTNRRGGFLDVSLLDGAIAWLGHSMGYLYLEGIPEAERDMALSGKYACYSIYRTKDGKNLTIASLEPKFWKNLCEKVGREDYISLQFSPGEKQQEIKACFEEMFLTKTRDDWMDFFEGTEICAGPVYDVDEVFVDPQVIHRKIFTEVVHPGKGPIKQIDSLSKLAGDFTEKGTYPPGLGQHTDEVLQNLGIREVEIARLRGKGII